MKKKSITLAVLAVPAIAVMMYLGAGLASAEGNGEDLAERIATKFNLNQAEVEQVFEEHREERDAERQQDLSDRLQERVDSGEITAEQKPLIENKLKEMENAREELRDQDLSREEMQTKMKAMREELKTWVESNGLELEDVMPFGMGRGHGGMGGPREQ